MTKEYREYAKSRIEYLLKISSFVFDERDKEALEAAIKALSQEPCDAISREKVLEMITDFATLELYIDKHNHVTFEPLEKLIKSLPSVTQKSGKWIKGKCSICGEHAPFWSMASTYYESKYCPNCGSAMKGE